MYGRGDRFNSFTGVSDPLSAVPNGHLAPSAWVLPRKAGNMASINEAVGTSSGLGQIQLGFNLNATCSATSSGSGVIELIALLSAICSATSSGVGTLSLIANLEAICVANSNGTGTLTLITDLIATCSATSSASGTLLSEIFLQSAPISQELTPEAVASAVWAAIATANNTAGTMGAKLNLASSGSVDYEDLAQAVRDELTAELIAIGVIKAKTDSLTFDVAGQVNSNITFVNDVEIQGSGTDSNPFNPS
jgi:hypothetical protein